MPGLTEPSQIGKREDLADLIAYADVKTTPFTSMVNKSKAPTNTLFEWLVDRYEKPSTAGTVDGSDVGDFENAAQRRLRLKNHVQVFRRTGKVSRLAENVSVIPQTRSEISNAAAKKLVEIKRDMEAAFLGGNDAQADNGAVPYLTCALDVWVSVAGPTLYPISDANYLPVSAQINTTAAASLTEDTDVQGILTAIFNSTGMQGDYKLIAGSVLRRRFTDMTRTVANTTSTSTKVRSFNIANDAGTVGSSTTIYQGDFGTIEILASSFIGVDSSGDPDTDRGYLLDMNKVHLRYNKMPTVESLADNGGGPRVLVEAVAGLQIDNPAGFGKFKP